MILRVLLALSLFYQIALGQDSSLTLVDSTMPNDSILQTESISTKDSVIGVVQEHPKEPLVLGGIKTHGENDEEVQEFIEEQLISILTNAQFDVRRNRTVKTLSSAKFYTNSTNQVGPILWGNLITHTPSLTLKLSLFDGSQIDSIILSGTVKSLYTNLPHELASLLTGKAGYNTNNDRANHSSILPTSSRSVEQIKEDLTTSQANQTIVDIKLDSVSTPQKEYVVVSDIVFQGKDKSEGDEYIFEHIISTLDSAGFKVGTENDIKTIMDAQLYYLEEILTESHEKKGPIIWGKATKRDSVYSLTLYIYNGNNSDSITIVDTLLPLVHQKIPLALTRLLTTSNAGYNKEINSSESNPLLPATRSVEQMRRDIYAVRYPDPRIPCNEACKTVVEKKKKQVRRSVGFSFVGLAGLTAGSFLIWAIAQGFKAMDDALNSSW